ncbi:MAG: DUF2510 domain-containing protein [Acidobacteria bacterium]|nr:DUF2510 domain-containing protein [Acidobacteriota bacterium]
MSDSTGQVPAGWYPDPSGERQWRVWNGSDWSHVTRPYGEVATPTSPVHFGVDDLATLGTLRRLTQFGILAYYTGFALLISLIAHWPGRAHPVSPRFASATLGAAIGLTLIGALAFAATVRALRGRWTLDAVIPVLNTFTASRWMSRRLELVNAGPRQLIDVLLTVGFILLCPTQPWVGVALASVAFNQLARTYALIDQLSGPALTAA